MQTKQDYRGGAHCINAVGKKMLLTSAPTHLPKSHTIVTFLKKYQATTAAMSNIDANVRYIHCVALQSQDNAIFQERLAKKNFCKCLELAKTSLMASRRLMTQIKLAYYPCTKYMKGGVRTPKLNTPKPSRLPPCLPGYYR